MSVFEQEGVLGSRPAAIVDLFGGSDVQERRIVLNFERDAADRLPWFDRDA